MKKAFLLIFMSLPFYFIVESQFSSFDDYNENDGMLFTGIIDSTAYPITDSTSQNSELNQIFSRYGVFYFKRATFDYEGVELYEIRCTGSEVDLYFELRELTSLLTSVIDFSPGNIQVYAIDNSALPVNDSSSGNDNINSILRDYNVWHYKLSYPSSGIPELRNIIDVWCNCIHYELHNRLLPLDTVFSDIRMIARGYPDDQVGNLTNSIKHDMYMYPNPFQDYLTIQNNFHDKLNIRIFGIDGIIIFQDVVYTRNPINLSHINSGLYIVQILNDDGDIISNRLIVKSNLNYDQIR